MVALMSTCFHSMHCYFFDSYLAHYLTTQFQLTQSGVGLAFSGFGLGLAMSGVIASLTLAVLSPISTIVVGLLLTGFCTMMIGPSAVLGFSKSLTLTYSGLFSSGMFSGLIFTPTYGEINNESK